MAGVGEDEHKEEHRQIHKSINEKSHRRPEKQHRCSAHRGSEKHRDVASGGIEPNRALQVFTPNDVVDNELTSWSSHYSGHAMYHQQNAGVPYLNRIGKKKNPPRQRDPCVHQLGSLKNPTAVVTVGERPKVNRKK